MVGFNVQFKNIDFEDYIPNTDQAVIFMSLW